MVAHRNEIPTFTSGEALEADRFVKFSTLTLVYCDAGDEPVGITNDAVAISKPVSITPINASGVVRVTAGAAISAGGALYTANDGKVSSVAVGRRLGTAAGAATADGGIIPAMINIYAGGLMLKDTDVVRFMEDFIRGGIPEDGSFISETADKGEWLQTLIDDGTDAGDVTAIADDAVNGILTITTNDAAGDGQQLQLNGESFKLTSGKQVYIETRFAMGDVDATDLFIGLAITDTTVLGGVTDRIGVEVLHDGNVKALVEKDSTETLTDTTVDIADGTLATFATTSVKVGLLYDGDEDEVRVFVDDVYKITLAAANIPDDEAMTPTIAVLANGAAAETVWVDYLKIEMER